MASSIQDRVLIKSKNGRTFQLTAKRNLRTILIFFLTLFYLDLAYMFEFGEISEIDVVESSETLKLSTSFTGEKMNYGIMFEIVAINDIVIRAFDVHCSSTNQNNVELYNKQTFLDGIRHPSKWSKIFNEPVIVYGQGKPR